MTAHSPGGGNTALAALASKLGLDARHVQRAHRAFLDGLLDAALADEMITDEEIDQLCRAAALLDLDLDFVSQRTDAYRTVADTIEPTPELEICFTGSATDESGAEIDRADLESLAIQNGSSAETIGYSEGLQPSRRSRHLHAVRESRASKAFRYSGRRIKRLPCFRTKRPSPVRDSTGGHRRGPGLH